MPKAIEVNSRQSEVGSVQLGRGAGAAILVCLALSSAGFAQTNDRFYRSWRWEQSPLTAREAGLGGAVVALADDAGAVVRNPAGLTTLPKTELTMSVREGANETLGIGDSSAEGAQPGLVGGAGLLSPKWGIGGYLTRPRAMTLALTDVELPDGSVDSGLLEGTVTDVGGALAWNPRGSLHLGVRVTATHLELEGSHSQDSATGATVLRVGTSSGATRVTGSLGVLYGLGERTTLGLLVTPGASWKAERTAVNPEVGSVLDAGSEYEIRAPGRVSAGAAVRLDERLVLSAQVDYVRYSEIRSTLVIRRGAFGREDYALDDAIEPRLGAELSFPMGGLSLQARAGVHSQAPGALAYQGLDAAEAAAFPGAERQLLVGAGGSLVTRSFRVDVGAMFGGDAVRALVGGAVRF